jgi:hypothetical protein
MTMEETGLITGLPGRSKMPEVPIMIIGGQAETEECRRAVVRATNNEWSGVTRSLDVLTTDSHPHFTCGKKRVLLMLPAGTIIPKVPPLLNLVGSEPQALGWAAVVGLLRPLWGAALGEAGEGTRHEWIYCVSDEPLVPVLLACRLETEPSVLFCPLHKVSNVGELAERVGNTLETSEAVPPLPWGDLGLRWNSFGQLFPKPVLDDSEGEGEAPAPPRPPAAKRRPRPIQLPETAVAKPPPAPTPKKKAAKKPKPVASRTEPAAEVAVSSGAQPATGSGSSQLRSRLATPEPAARRERSRTPTTRPNRRRSRERSPATSDGRRSSDTRDRRATRESSRERRERLRVEGQRRRDDQPVGRRGESDSGRSGGTSSELRARLGRYPR